ncbi:MAG: pyrroloquinoline quinone biosynthesis peptide chaperone PqqD [Sphingomonadaceae bacterium]
MQGTDVVPSRASDVVWRKMGEETVLLSAKSENYYSLNEVGTRIWELIDGQATAGEIASRIAEEYDAPAEQVEQDVVALLHELREQGLVV